MVKTDCFGRIFKIAQHSFGTGMGKLDCLKRPVRWSTVLLKDEELA